MTRLLFICTEGRHRSVTAADHWVGRCVGGLGPFETRAVGTHPSAAERLREGHVVWADVIVCAEERHEREIRRRFPDAASMTPLTTLGIPDEYQRNNPELVALIADRLPGKLVALTTNEAIVPSQAKTTDTTVTTTEGWGT